MNKQMCPPCNHNCNQRRMCPAYLNQANSDGTDPDEGFYEWAQDMAYAGVRLFAAAACIAAVVATACAFRVAGWI